MHAFNICCKVTNLYGRTTIQYLPRGEFKWLTWNVINKFDVNSIEKDYEEGYISTVDLKYPKELHDLHKTFSVALEKKSGWGRNAIKSLKKNLKEYENWNGNVKRHIPNLTQKEKNVVHDQKLQLYLQLWMKLTKVHGVLKFKEAPKLKPYLNFKNEKRKRAT